MNGCSQQECKAGRERKGFAAGDSAGAGARGADGSLRTEEGACGAQRRFQVARCGTLRVVVTVVRTSGPNSVTV